MKGENNKLSTVFVTSVLMGNDNSQNSGFVIRCVSYL